MGEHILIKSCIYKLVYISLSYRKLQLNSSSDLKGDTTIPSSYKPNYSMYKLPLSHRLTKPYFLKRYITTAVHEKLRPPLKILSTLRNPCKQHIMVLYHSPKTREVFNVLLSATGEWPLHFN